jgi:hypothetical protein
MANHLMPSETRTQGQATPARRPAVPPAATRTHADTPTPVAGNSNDGADTGTWQARRERQKKLGCNGNSIGTPLPVAIALLPTPMAGDVGADKASGPVRPSRAKRQTGGAIAACALR